jgi:hypothetical protein
MTAEDLAAPDAMARHDGEPKPGDQAPDATSQASSPAEACAGPGEPTQATAPVRARWSDEDDDLLDDWPDSSEEPGPRGWDESRPEDEVHRDALHPRTTEPPARPDTPDAEPEPEPEPESEPAGPFLHIDSDDGQPLDAAAERALRARLARIKHDAYANQRHPHTGSTAWDIGANGTTDTGTGAATGTGSSGAGGASGGSGRGVRVRPGQTEIYVHLTDLTLATGSGVLRVESLGPMLAEQLAELVGYGPYTVKPVIDLNDAVSVDAYEIPDRIRERVRLTHPVEVFPFGTQETRGSMDLDHLRPYDPLGPPGQTSTTNLVPLGRYPHRVKTHAQGWDVRRVDFKTLEWSTPHGFRFHVDPTGTHRVPAPGQVPEEPN